MPRRFEFQEDGSNKFWEVDLDQAELITRYGKIGASGKETRKPFADAATAAREADKLIADKLRKGYQEIGGAGPAAAMKPPSASKPTAAASDPDALLQGLTGATIVKRFTWADKKRPHWGCSELSRLIRAPGVSDDTIAQVITATLQAFTFVPSRDFVPEWMEGKRTDGSGLIFLLDALEFLHGRDLIRFTACASQALPYIIAEGEAIDHDEDGEAWDAYSRLIALLEPLYRTAGADFPAELSVTALERTLDLINSSHVRGDPLALPLALLESGIDQIWKRRLSVAILKLVWSDGLNGIADAIRDGGLSAQSATTYATRLAAIDDDNAQLAAVLSAAKPHDFKFGRALGASSDVFHCPAINGQKNDECHLLAWQHGKVTVVGTFPLVPKVMCLTDDGLLVAMSGVIYRVADGAWTRVFDTGGEVNSLTSDGRSVCAVGGTTVSLCRNGVWSQNKVDGLGEGAVLNSGVFAANGALWLSGTKGVLGQLVDGTFKRHPPVDDERKNYRLFSAPTGLFLITTTGTFLAGAKGFNKVITGKSTTIAAVGERVFVTVGAECIQLEHGKETARWPIAAQFVGSAGDALIASLGGVLLMLRNGRWSVLQIPATLKPQPVVLP